MYEGWDVSLFVCFAWGGIDLLIGGQIGIKSVFERKAGRAVEVGGGDGRLMQAGCVCGWQWIQIWHPSSSSHANSITTQQCEVDHRPEARFLLRTGRASSSVSVSSRI